MIKNLGVLTLEQKQEIWKNKMSGSQVKKTLQNPQEQYLIKTGQKEMIDLSKTRAKRWLDMGNYMEPVIIEMAKGSLELDIKTDKSTFEKVEDDFFTANIDGYIGESPEAIETIIEIKNLSKGDVNEMLSNYLNQIDYYMWFFGAKNAKLIALIAGNDLKVIDIERDEAREAAMLAKLKDFQMNLNMGIEPSVVETSNKIDGDEAKELLGPGVPLERFSEVKKELKALKEEEKSLINDIKVAFKQYDKAEVIDGLFTVTKTNSVRKGGIDKDAMIEFLIEKTGDDYIKLSDKFRKNDTVTETVRLKEAK